MMSKTNFNDFYMYTSNDDKVFGNILKHYSTDEYYSYHTNDYGQKVELPWSNNKESFNNLETKEECDTNQLKKNINNYEYKGCYIEKQDRTISDFLGNVNTVDECIRIADSKNYNIIGYQRNGACYGSNDSSYSKYGKQISSNCNISNIGNWTNIVYEKKQEKVKFELANNIDKVKVVGKYNNDTYWITKPNNKQVFTSKVDGNKYQYLFKNTTGFSLKITINLVCKNIAKVFINNVEQPSEKTIKNNMYYFKINCELANGTNLIEINTDKQDNVAMYAIDNKTKTILFQTNKNWFYVTSIQYINLDYSKHTKPVTIIGKYGIDPWKNTSNFIDIDANWITDSINSNNNKITVEYVFNNNTNTDINATLHLIVDSECTLKINDIQIDKKFFEGWYNNNYSRINISIKPGKNKFTFKIKSQKNNCALLVSCINNSTGKILFNTNDSWKYVDEEEIKIINENKDTLIINEMINKFDTELEQEQEQENQPKSVMGNKLLNLHNIQDVNNLMIDGVFKLRVNLPKMPSYIKGHDFKEVDPNYFYLCVESLDPNCSIKSFGDKCIQTYADNKNCQIKSLTTHNTNNSYRLVLISSTYVNDINIPFGKNCDFTLVNIDNKIYLKNIQTGFMPSLFLNDTMIDVYGDMQINDNTNANTMQQNLKNILCNEKEQKLQTDGTLFTRCKINTDDSLYLMTSKNFGNSTPIRIDVNNDNTISFKLLRYNSYGYATNIYSLIFCNFNVQTFEYIEKITNTVGTFFVNMVCFDDYNGGKYANSNNLKFSVELKSYPKEYIKKMSIHNVGK